MAAEPNASRKMSESKTVEGIALPTEDRSRRKTPVIPGLVRLVPGIQPSTSAGESGTMEPGAPGRFAGAGKHRDDRARGPRTQPTLPVTPPAAERRRRNTSSPQVDT